MESGIYKISGKVRDYAWGGYNFIPALIGNSAKQENPSAEYWLGAHPNDPAVVHLETGNRQDLTELQSRAGDLPLPFLMKVLDVRGMLSIQVHPSRKLAEIGFASEEKAGIPRDAAERTYKDNNHKPELMFALSDFWMLHGLRPEAELAEEFERRYSCRPLLSILKEEGLAGLVNAAVSRNNPLIEAISKSLIQEAFGKLDAPDKASHDFWIRRWVEDNPGVERGLLMILIMNLVNLKPGEAVYQPDGLIHAYLEGRNIEIMANSDNVLRAGLTVKHINASELLNIALLESSCPDDFLVRVPRDGNGIRSFETPFDDFLLQELEVAPVSSTPLSCERSRILLYYSGEPITLKDGFKTIHLQAGECAFALKGTQIEINNPTQRTAQIFIGS